MEIRNVVSEVKNEYPQINQVSKKHLVNNIPSKWLKLGISSLVITFIMKNKVLAVSLSDFDEITIAGGMSTLTPTPVPIQICNIACPIILKVSLVVFIMTYFGILINIIKSKYQSESTQIRKWLIILCIISIIVFFLSFVTTLIINQIL